MSYTTLKAIEKELNQQIKERPDAIRCGLVAVVAQVPFIQAGPPGVAKTLLMRSFAQRVLGARYFEMDMTESTTPEKLMGPLNVPKYVNEGVYEQVLTNGLGNAELAMIDEFFNGNQVVLHEAMPVILERRYKMGDGTMLAVPLLSAFMGTNKIITDDPELAPVWDRIPLRVVVDYIQDPMARRAMALESLARRASHGDRANAHTPGMDFTTVTLDELKQANKEALALDLSDRAIEVHMELGEELRSQGVIISDRRFAESWPLVQANAWLNGHDQVEVTDLDILVHSWWTDYENKAKVFSTITEAVNPLLREILQLTEYLRVLKSEMEQVKDNDPTEVRKAIHAQSQILNEKVALLQAMGDDSRAQRLIAEYQSYTDELKTILSKSFGL